MTADVIAGLQDMVEATTRVNAAGIILIALFLNCFVFRMSIPFISMNLEYSERVKIQVIGTLSLRLSRLDTNIRAYKQTRTHKYPDPPTHECIHTHSSTFQMCSINYSSRARLERASPRGSTRSNIGNSTKFFER
jgi:hypothetical protein